MQLNYNVIVNRFPLLDEDRHNELIYEFFDVYTNENALEEVKSLIKKQNLSYDYTEQFYLQDALRFSCTSSDTSIVEYLLTSPDIIIKPNIFKKTRGEGALQEASMKGRLDNIKFILERPEFLGNDIEELKTVIFDCFMYACQFSRFNVIDYLLENYDFKNEPRYQESIGLSLKWACKKGNFAVIKHLPHSIILQEYKEKAFIEATNESHEHIIQYIVFEGNIRNTLNIQNFLIGKTEKSGELVNRIYKMFIARELNQKLSKNVSCTKETTKAKI